MDLVHSWTKEHLLQTGNDDKFKFDFYRQGQILKLNNNLFKTVIFLGLFFTVILLSSMYLNLELRKPRHAVALVIGFYMLLIT
jgi:hypothetical protein